MTRQSMRIVRADAVAGGLGHDAFGDGKAGLGGIGDAAFVERKADDVGARSGRPAERSHP